MKDFEQIATEFVKDIADYHEDILTVYGQDAGNVVMIKSIALLVLAFDIPPFQGHPVDYDDAMEKLGLALKAIRELEKRGDLN